MGAKKTLKRGISIDLQPMEYSVQK